MTKGQIDNLGNSIRNEFPAIVEDTLQSLQDYRISHKEPLSAIFNNLCQLSRRVNKNSIITYRIKRFESIIGKLNRFPEMRFNRMWDIGGCRCILQNNKEVYRLKNIIAESPLLEIIKEYDYIESPQEEGYKSLHLFVRISNSSTVVEVQIRNQVDHNWATLVEITDLLFDTKLKEYSDNKDLLRFHRLLSKRSELGFEERKEIADIINQYKYFDKLSEVFARNYLQVRKQWLDIEGQNGHKYFLIETKKDEVPRITSFSSFSNAEKNYFAVYKSSHNANIVLTHLPVPNYKHISIGYSNYILTFHSFLDDCYDIFESILRETLEKREYKSFLFYFELYMQLVFNHIKNLVSEIYEIAKISNVNKGKQRLKEKEWRDDINKQIDKRQNKARDLYLLLQNNKPDRFFRRIWFNSLTKAIIKNYDQKIRKIVDTMQ